MKKFSIVLFTLVIFSLVLFSCNNMLLPKGTSLSIRLPGVEQSRFAFVKPETLAYFTIILTKENGKSQEKTAKAGETIVFDSLTAATYTVSAKAFDNDNNCVAYAQDTVKIKAGQDTSVVLNLIWNLLTEEAIASGEVKFVVTPPKKTTYTLGEYFDSTGLKVEAVFKNGYRQEIPALIQSDTGEISQPIYYDLEPVLESQSQITASTNYQITVTIKYLEDINSDNGSQTIDKPFTLTLNVPNPVIKTEPESQSVNTSNAESAPACTLSVETDYVQALGYEAKYQWYRVENGNGIELEDNNETYPQYSNVTGQELQITFDSGDTNTYQYYVEVTNSISKQPTMPTGVTYGTRTATTKSKIVTVTTTNNNLTLNGNKIPYSTMVVVTPNEVLL
ncbi:MAG: bacterial Ig-like domain-containing protein [Spirochaetaceae bacterium]|nr:bacterial Ig-like domain-containing protein [Spirochaetaceae bacterium]